MAYSWHQRTTEPVGHTCPIVDGVIEIIQALPVADLIEWLQGIEFEDNDDERPLADQRDTFVEALENCDIDAATAKMEDLRAANAKLREWGGKNANEADEFEEKYEEEQKKNEALERRIAELEEIINSRDAQIEVLEADIESLEDTVRNHPG